MPRTAAARSSVCCSAAIMHPKDFASITTPVPMDVPRIRYELGTRRVGTSPPIANAGPDQLNVPALITLMAPPRTIRWAKP